MTRVRLRCTACEQRCVIETSKVPSDKWGTICWLVDEDGPIPIELSKEKRRGE